MKAEKEWNEIFDNIGWDYITNIALEKSWFDGQDERGKYASFWYGDFEETAHRMSIHNAMK